MQNTLLLCTVELLLFKLADAAPDLQQNKMKSHKRIEYNQNIIRDEIDGSNQNGDLTVSTNYPGCASPTDSLPSLPTIFACGAQAQAQAQDTVTTIYLDDGDMFDEDTETDTDDLTIWQTVTATETDIYADGGCGCAAPTPDPLPVITSYLPDPVQPIVQTICPAPAPAPPSISICTMAVPTTVTIDNTTPTTTPVAVLPAPIPAPCPTISLSPEDDTEPEYDTAPCGCNEMDLDYEHPFGDDTLDWVLDTKDHTRHRWENFKDRADRAVSHVRPSHVHDRISQVLHDGRPERSDEHRELHHYHGNVPVQDRRARARYERKLRNSARSRSRYPYTYEREYYDEPPLRRVREPSKRPSAPDPPRRAREPIRQAGPVRRQPCGAEAAPVRRPCADPAPVRDTCRAPRGGSDYEHQYGDDTMDFMLDTKDHTRHLYNRVKDRTKKATSHFRPSHMHDRVDQLVHDEHPERTEDHLVLHEHRGYL